MLRPCPFCGCRAVPRPWNAAAGIVAREPHFVRCMGCGIATKLYDSRDAAEAAWNRRTYEADFIAWLHAPEVSG